MLKKDIYEVIVLWVKTQKDTYILNLKKACIQWVCMLWLQTSTFSIYFKKFMSDEFAKKLSI